MIVLPFTAPFHNCDLSDLFRIPGAAPSESAAMPVTSEADSADAFTSPLDASALSASTSLVVIPRLALSGPLMGSFDLSPSPQVQPAVLRV
jgi:hypothetical protein